MRSVLLMLALVLLASVPARCDDASLREALEPIYTRINTAYSARDLRPMLSVLARDFESRELDGKVYDAQAYKKLQEDTLVGLDTAVVSARIVSVEKIDGRAVATVDNHMEGTFRDDKGAPHKIVSNETTKDTWIQTGSGWMIERSEQVEESVELDGKRQ